MVLPNPRGIKVSDDTESGVEPTRLPKGVNFHQENSSGAAPLDMSNPPRAEMIPDGLQTASTAKIGRPAPDQEGISLRGVKTDVPKTDAAKTEETPPVLSATPAAPNLPDQKPTIPSLSKLGQQTEKDRETQQQLGKGSGISQIGNPWARGALRGLNVIGGIVAPTLMSRIPGTEEHHQALVAQNNKAITGDEAQAEKEAQTSEANARTGEATARAGLTEAQTAALNEPKPKEEKWGEFPGYTDKDGTPLVREENSGQVVRADTKKPPAGFQVAAPKTDKPDNPQQQLIDAEGAVAAAKTPEEKKAAQAKLTQLRQSIADYAASSQRPEKSGAGSARADKSYTYNNDKLDKLGKPIEDAQARMGRLRETLAQGTPQADALVAPELLTIMAGGAGSGLRMNEAEIQRVVGGRSKWESLKASINQWQLDPTKANSITPEQRKQIRDLVDAVNVKLQKKQEALDAAREGLLNSDDPKDHRKIVTDAHHALTQVDEGNDKKEAPAAGAVVDGYKFKGGDPADEKNWEKVK